MRSHRKTALFGILITIEVIILVLAALAFMLPIQDYALHEYRIWLSNPSTESWKAFQDKKREEADIRPKPVRCSL
jgi:hypothetical protein